jgi:large subunit ribosomal protein L10
VGDVGGRTEERKAGIVEEALKLLKEYEVIGAADLRKIGSRMLQDLRKKLRGRIVFRVIKSTLMRRAMEKLEMPNIEEFFDTIKGQNIFIFYNGNPFELAMILRRNKVKVFARPGDIAIEEIVVPAGNTGLSPGPILSQFASLRVRTRIESGSIWVVRDTVVAKPGDIVSRDLAEVLSRLGMRVAEMGLEIKAVYDHGRIIPREELLLDTEAYREELVRAYSDALRVAVEAAYPTTETLPLLLSKVHLGVRRITLEAGYPAAETMGELLTLAQMRAMTLERVIEDRLKSASPLDLEDDGS